MDGGLGPSCGDPEPIISRKAKFGTQANALFRKKVLYQLRNKKTTCCALAAPVFFCLILLLIQLAVNSALSTDSLKCGCKCLECCKTINNVETCRVATDAEPCQPGDFDRCAQKTTECGIQYSDGTQAGYCAISQPNSWPAMLQVAEPEERAEPYRPNATVIYTGESKTAASEIASLLLSSTNAGTPPSANSTALAAAYLNRSSPENPIEGRYVGEAISALGYILGSPADEPRTYYLENAFTNNTACSSGDNSTAELPAILDALGTSSPLLKPPPFSCAALSEVWVDTPAVADRMLYCGYKQARCNASSDADVLNEYTSAFDFRNTDEQRFNVVVWQNDTVNLLQGQAPPYRIRVLKGINLLSNAYVQWALGPDYALTLAGVMEMPKQSSRLRLDFSSLLGPLFFTWVAQLLLPVIMMTLVYEKQNRIRIMMKMHGPGDFAYWVIMYTYFIALYMAYILLLLAFGSAINLKFFRLTSYSLQIVFYLLWANCLVSFAFVASTFFTNSKTAIVCAFLWTFGTGLLGNLLFETYFGRNVWWTNLVELIPAFALYRGLYEISQYSFRATYTNTSGLTWEKLGDPNNGMPVVLIIMAVEGLIMLPLAWYLDQVLPTGTGVRRHPLFFLPSSWRKKHRKVVPQKEAQLRADGKAKPPGGIEVTAETPSLGDPSAKHPGTDTLEHEGIAAIQVESVDVDAERRRVEALVTYGGQAMVVKDLRKVYPPQDGNPAKVAVKSLTMAISRGECFGLLGPNGAGKSTAINMLVGLIEPTAGGAWVSGLDIRQDMDKIYSMMGVCPQHDILWEQLSGREHLLFYGRLKSLKGPILLQAVEEGLRNVNLWAGGVADKQCGRYSGGMKRRLSVAISLIGSPSVVYMDEPSTGLDPASRRNLWDVVRDAKDGRGIILTTHNMEEAEVLCDRLGIFVDGQLVCIGSPKELTTRYGEYLVLTINTAPSDVEAAEAFVRKLAPSCRKTYAIAGTQRFELLTSEVTLSQVFDAMERFKTERKVFDWGVANATLEEVFIKFARSIGAEGGG